MTQKEDLLGLPHSLRRSNITELRVNPMSKVPYLIQALNLRKKANRDTILIFCGEKRSGKSYAAMRLGEMINPNFNADKQVHFDPKPFIQYMYQNTDGYLVLDEAAEGMNPRAWYEISSKMLNALLRTQGFRRNVIVFCLPHLGALDTWAINLSHYLIINYKYTGTFNVYRINASQFKRKEMGHTNYWETLSFKLPSENNIKIYEAKKKIWNDKKLTEDIDFLEMMENPETYKKTFNPKFYLDGLKSGVITEDLCRAKLKKIGYMDVDIQMMIDMVIQKKEEKERPKYLEPIFG
jgi:hypothetical protein